MNLKDPNTSRSMNVSTEGYGQVSGFVRNQGAEVNLNGEAYSQSFSYTTADAHTFYFLKNTHTTKKLHITGLRCQATAADSFQVLIGTTGTPGGGAAITPVNANASSSAAAQCTSYGDAEVTGLTDGTEFDQVFHIAAGESKYHEFPHEIILGTNHAISLKAIAAETWNVTVFFYFK